MKDENFKINIKTDKLNVYTKRSEMIKLLNKLVHKLRFRSQTFYLSILYLDLIMNLNTEIKVELITISVLLLAAKFDENDTTVPNLIYFKNLMENYFITLDDIQKYELICLNMLEYKLNYNTAYHYINFFLSQGIIFNDESLSSIDNEYVVKNYKLSTSNSSLNSNEDVKINYKIVVKLSEIVKEALLIFIESMKKYLKIDNEFNNFTFLEIACGCIAVAREHIKLKEIWHSRFIEIYNIKIEDFKDCYEMLKK